MALFVRTNRLRRVATVVKCHAGFRRKHLLHSFCNDGLVVDQQDSNRVVHRRNGFNLYLYRTRQIERMQSW